MLATTNGYLTLIGTPNGRNHFWRFYGMGQAQEHGVWSRTGPSSESPYVSKVFLAIQRELITDRAYRVEYEAEFMDSENQFFRTEAVESCLVMQLPEARGDICIGVDWGKNQDATAVAVVQGDALAASVLEVVAIEGSSWELLCERVAAVVHKYPAARVLSDETGNGNPMVELLKKSCPNRSISGLSFNNENKSEMAFGLAAMFEHRRLAMRPNPALQRELQYYEMSETDMGRPKFGAAQGLHDDLVTALMLANRLLRDPTGGRVMKGRQRSALFASQ
jgi:phage FluMu gp28-like protein